MSQETWMITGASRGFGRAFAEYAVSQGYNVVATARRQESLSDLVALAPDQVLAVDLDVTKPDTIDAARDLALNRFGSIDVLINNAGYGTVGAVEETPEEELRALFETNFFGAVAVTRSMLPQMRAQRSGAVVNISSMGGQMSMPGFGPYSATKFALEGISEALRGELEPFGVKVMIVEPGAFRTDFAGEALRHMPKIDAYQSVVGGTREFSKGMDGTQAGDPKLAAQAVGQALKAEVVPLRLVLGTDAYEAVKAHAEALLEDMDNWKDTSLSVEYAR